MLALTCRGRLRSSDYEWPNPGERRQFDEVATERPNKTHAPKRISSRRIGNSAIRAMMNSRPCSVTRRGS
jgi:hypothetical protein